jgi:serine/threonine protein kinase
MGSYVISPVSTGEGSREAHEIRTSAALANLPIREALELAKQKARKIFSFDPQQYGAKKLGGGAYGTAYLMKVTPASFVKLQEGLSFGGGRIITSMPQMGSTVVVKIAKQKGGKDSSFYQENIRENVVHKRLSVALCYSPPRADRPICVSRHVPKFFLSYIQGAPGRLESVTVMDLAGNMDLDKFVSRKDIPVSLFVEIERAICSMWLAGYIHGDLHRANLMIDTRTYSIKLIDFGFALKMPPGFVDVLARRISNMIARGDMKSLGEVWTEKPIDGKLRLINYSNRVMKGKGYPWYNPDYKILRTLYNQVPRKLRNQIPAARSALWGIKMGDVAALPQRQRTSRRTAFRSSPALSSRDGRTYRTSRTFRRSSPSGPKTASIKEATGRRQDSARKKEELARQQSARKKEELARQQSARKKEELARQQSAKKKEELARQQSAKKKEELARQQSAKKKEELARQQSAKKKEELARQIAKKKSATPQWQKRSPQTKLSSPLRKLSNAERAAVYGQKRRSPNTAIADLQRRKADCQQRGLFYNPILKQCVRTMKTPVTPGRCREDCAAIGKRCGPKGRCVKL